jgi:hypothetical protein
LGKAASVAIRVLRHAGRNSSLVFITTHAERRMRERRISRLDIQRCLELGVIEEGPFRNDKDLWQMTVRRRSAGEEIRVVVAVDPDSMVVVVTAYRGDV